MLRSRFVIGTWRFVEVVATDSKHVECRWNVILRTLCILSRNCRSLHKWLIEPDIDIGSITFDVNDVIEINIRGTVICKSRVLTLSEISGNCEFESPVVEQGPIFQDVEFQITYVVGSGFYESVVTYLNIHTFGSLYVSFSRNFNNSLND